MDVLDKKILCELDKNCRQPSSKIAKAIGSSRAVVNYRIKKLEDGGVIGSYITAINLGKLGFSTYKVYFKLYNLDDVKEKALIQNITSSKNAIHSIKTEGAFDLSVVVAVRNIKELDSFMSGLKNKFSDIIRDYQISIVVSSKVFKFSKIVLGKVSKEPKIEKFSGAIEKSKVDDKDRKILSSIATEANMPIIEISKKTKLSVDIVKYRLKQLKDSGIINTFRIIVNGSKLGFYHYVILVKTRRATKNDEDMINSWAKLHPKVMYITKRIGNWDYELNVALKDIEDLNSFISEMRKQFSGILESYDTLVNTRIMKLNYLPI